MLTRSKPRPARIERRVRPVGSLATLLVLCTLVAPARAAEVAEVVDGFPRGEDEFVAANCEWC